MKRTLSLSVPALLMALLLPACAPAEEEARPKEPVAPARVVEAFAPARYVLALSWQPAFCEGAQGRPECRSQHEGRPDAKAFSLHGLWPQPIGKAWCGVPESERSRRWRDYDMARLSPALRNRLDAAMPGAASHLDRYEWTKHGTCIPGATPETYFAVSLDLLDAVNDSAVGEFFARNIGRGVSGREIRAAFDTSFGRGAGSRIRIACDNDGGRRLIREITISLEGALGPDPDVAALIAAAPTTDPGCPGGIIDAAGLQ